MQYRDVIIEAFEVDAAQGRYAVRVQHSEAGNMPYRAATPFTIDRHQINPQLEQLAQSTITHDALVALGRRLAAWLLPDTRSSEGKSVRDLFLSSQVMMAQKRNDSGQEWGVRLRLVLPPNLADLPWEYVYVNSAEDSGAIRGFLALDPRVALVRDEMLNEPVTGLKLPPTTLSIIAAFASPTYDDLVPLNIAVERKHIEQTFADEHIAHAFNVSIIEEATLDKLQEHLRSAVVFHFAGHGRFTSRVMGQPQGRAGKGQIALQDGWVDAEQLSVNIRGTNVRLVVLGGCKTGQRDVHNHWNGVAMALVKDGVPAVVAHQFRVSDACAIAFSKAFYQAFVGGASIERAVSAGRIAVYNRMPHRYDWGSAVLYLRVAEGQLFVGVNDLPARGKAAHSTETMLRHAMGLDVPTGPESLAAVKPESNPRVYATPPRVSVELISREREAASLLRALQDQTVRALQLNGPAGVGKTSLALHVVAQLGAFFGDGIVFVNLAYVVTAEDVLFALATALQLPYEPVASPGRTFSLLFDQLCAHLHQKRLLLILDPCEHLPAAAPLLNDLLARCRSMKLLITSQSTVPVHTDYLLPVGPLNSAAAVQLLAKQAGFETALAGMAPAELRVLHDLCADLDHLPLAIELAAPWLHLYTPDELKHQLSLRMLQKPAFERAGYQQSMQRTLDWSYALLDEDAQLAVVYLAVFAGLFTLAAAHTVLADTYNANLDSAIKDLLDRRMLHSVEGAGETKHFAALRLVRAYASERLNSSPHLLRLRQRHAAYYQSLVQQAEPNRSAQFDEWLKVIQTYYEDILSALIYFLDQQHTAAALELSHRMWLFWHTRGTIHEGCQLIERALDLPGEARSPQRAKALYAAGYLALLQGNSSVAHQHGHAARTLAEELGDEQTLADAYNLLGEWARTVNKLDQAQGDYQQSLRFKRRIGDRRGIAATLNNLGLLARQREHLLEAQTLFAESRTISQNIGYLGGAAAALNNLGELTFDQQYYATAWQYFQQSHRLYEQLHDHRHAADLEQWLGATAFMLEDYTLATEWYTRSLTSYQQLANQEGIGDALEHLGSAAERQGQYPTASDHYRAALKLARQPSDQQRVEARLRALPVAS